MNILKSVSLNVFYTPERPPAPPFFKCWQRVCLSPGPPTASVILSVSSSTPRSLFVALTGKSSPPPLLPRSLVVRSLLHQTVVLCDALSSQLFQDVVEVSGVGEAVARQVGAELCLMVDLEERDKCFLLSQSNKTSKINTSQSELKKLLG